MGKDGQLQDKRAARCNALPASLMLENMDVIIAEWPSGFCRLERGHSACNETPRSLRLFI